MPVPAPAYGLSLSPFISAKDTLKLHVQIYPVFAEKLFLLALSNELFFCQEQFMT
jgi:hypothetical protein